jgi:RimJ/RimL family protein N-acetyltransferase
LSNPAWTVRTGRLLLAPVAWHDLPDLQALKSDPAVFAQMLGGVRNPAQTAQDLADDISFWAAHSVGIWTVRQPGRPALLGLTGIHQRPDGRGFGLRFAFAAAARGHGYAREAAGAALHHAHDSAGLNRIVAVTKQSNFDSRIVLGAIGMRPMETFLRDAEPMLLFVSER